MKNLLTLFFVICQFVVYGQIDSLKISNPFDPDYSKTIYPKNDRLTYNQFVGETISGYNLANGWRKDSVNGGFNKEIYSNPYIKSESDYIGFDKNDYLKVYLYKNGKKFTGKILDTLNLSYSHPYRVGIYYYLETNYESKNIKVIFQTNCVNGLVNGVGTLSVLNSKKIVSQCIFKKGELVGEVKNIGILTDNIYKKKYKKGSYKAISQIETDTDGNKIEPDKKLSFKETYETLLNPYEILKQNKKAKQTYIENISKHGGLRNPLLLEPLDMILKYFSTIQSLTPIKKYQTNTIEISEFKYDDFKIIFNSFDRGIRNSGALIIECYDKYDRLIMVRYVNVHFEVITDLNSPEYLKFYEKVGYGYNLTTYKYDEKGTIIKAVKYEGVYDNDIDSMCDYSDITREVLSLTNSKPISIIN